MSYPSTAWLSGMILSAMNLFNAGQLVYFDLVRGLLTLTDAAFFSTPPVPGEKLTLQDTFPSVFSSSFHMLGSRSKESASFKYCLCPLRWREPYLSIMHAHATDYSPRPEQLETH